MRRARGLRLGVAAALALQLLGAQFVLLVLIRVGFFLLGFLGLAAIDIHAVDRRRDDDQQAADDERQDAQTALFLDGLGGRHGLCGRFGRRAVVIGHAVIGVRRAGSKLHDVLARLGQGHVHGVASRAVRNGLTNRLAGGLRRVFRNRGSDEAQLLRRGRRLDLHFDGRRDDGIRIGRAVNGERAVFADGRHVADRQVAAAAEQRRRVGDGLRGRRGVRVRRGARRGRRVVRHARARAARPAVVGRQQILKRCAVDGDGCVVVLVRGDGRAVRGRRGPRGLGEILLELRDGQHLAHVAADIAVHAAVIDLIPGVRAVVFRAGDQQQRVHWDAAHRRAGGGRRAAQVHRVLNQLGVGAGRVRAERFRCGLRQRSRGSLRGLQRGEIFRRLLLAHHADEVGAHKAPLAAVLHQIPRHAVLGELALEDVDDLFLVQDVLQIRLIVRVAAQRRAVVEDARVQAELHRRRRGGRFGRGRRGRRGFFSRFGGRRRLRRGRRSRRRLFSRFRGRRRGRRRLGARLRVAEGGNIGRLFLHAHQLDEFRHHVAGVSIRAHIAPVAFALHDPEDRAR